MFNPVDPQEQHLNIVAGDRLRPGSIVTARVMDDLGGNRYNLLLNGRRLTASSHFQLVAGRTIRARVETSPGGFRLRLLDSGSSAVLGSSNKIPLTVRGVFISALLHAGLPLPGDAELGRLAALLGRTVGPRRRMARLYAEILSKGGDPTAGFLENLLGILEASPRRDKRQGHQGKSWSSVPDNASLAEEMKGEGEDPDLLLGLLSEIPGPKGCWMFRKLSRHMDDATFYMTWKIRAGMEPAMALTIHDCGRTFEFLLEGLNPIRMAVFSKEDNSVDEKTWNSFREHLTLMNVDIGDTILPISESDGFTAHGEETSWD